MILKGLFISLYNVDADNVKGIRRKIEAQVKYFNKNCEKLDWIYRVNNGNVVCNGTKLFQGKKASQPLICSTFDFFTLKKYIDVNSYDFIYIRYLTGNLGLLNFVKHAKKNGVKVLVEIPTFPYLDELRTDLKGKINKILDNIVTKRLHKYVFRIVCTNKNENIFNIKTIQIDNGVDLEEVKAINKKNKDSKYINAIAVASICRWHGYDRFINSMYEYKINNELKMKFYLVGDGRKKDLQDLKDLVKEKKMQDYVIFTGAKAGKELDDLYENMDIAVSSLALFRAGGGHNPIKTKEYVAKGLPVITGYEDSLVPSTLDYIYKVNEDESIFRLEELLKWYEENNNKKDEIRSYALENVSWDVQVKKIINEITS